MVKCMFVCMYTLCCIPCLCIVLHLLYVLYYAMCVCVSGVCLCMYACIYAGMCMCMLCVSMYVCMYICRSVYICVPYMCMLNLCVKSILYISQQNGLVVMP